jgi:hypothetical protein
MTFLNFIIVNIFTIHFILYIAYIYIGILYNNSKSNTFKFCKTLGLVMLITTSIIILVISLMYSIESPQYGLFIQFLILIPSFLNMYVLVNLINDKSLNT